MTNARRKYLVNNKVQLGYMALIAVPLVTLLAGLYYLIYYSVFSQMLIPEAIATTLLPAMRHVNIVVVLAVPVLLFTILRVALIYSNRIVGPLPRLERELDKVLAGDYTVRLKARNKDELNLLIKKINMLLEKIALLHSS